MPYFPNRCFGCDHYNGWKGRFQGEETKVDCNLGFKSTIASGCECFAPDITATCSYATVECHFYRRSKDGFGECTQGLDNRLASIKYCEFFVCKDSLKHIEQKKSFISSLICAALGQADNTHELMYLRQFRNDVLKSEAKSSGMVDDYYRISPELAEKLRQHANHDEHEALLATFLQPCIELIKQGKHALAIACYRKMITFIKNSKAQP